MSTGRSVPPRGSKKSLEGRYAISEFETATGRPLGEHATKYVSHCGYLVTDKIPSLLVNVERSEVLLKSVLNHIVTRS